MARPRDPAKWDSLSPAYRARLERGGITRSGYLRGDTLGAARGHKPGRTPEHPKDAVKNPERYKGYKPRKEVRTTPQESAALTDAAVRSMDRKLAPGLATGADVFNYSPERVRENVEKMSASQKIWTIGATEDELMQAARRQVAGNPWFYH